VSRRVAHEAHPYYRGTMLHGNARTPDLRGNDSAPERSTHTVTSDATKSARTPVLQGKRERYEVVRPLAEGGFGITHLARRMRDGEEVVIKQLRMERLDDWKAFDLFEREATVLESLRHPNIPAFVDHFECKEGDALRGFALVQAYVLGKTLREVQRERPPSGSIAMRVWFTRLLEVCQYLHERTPPVIHRDITPKNVILRGDGEPVLIDFGTVQNALRSADTISSTSAGTFGYAAPEQLIGRAVPASDLYGLAMTYLAVATGREPEALPFVGNRVQVSEALREHDTHPRLVLLLEEMLDPDVARRPASAADVLGRLRAIPAAAASAATVALAPVDEASPVARAEQLWRARAARATRLGKAKAAAFSPAPKTDRIRNCVVDETGRRALLEVGFKEGVVVAIDLDTLEVAPFVDARQLQIYHPDVLFDVEGQTALLSSFGDGTLFMPTSSGEPRSKHLGKVLDMFSASMGDPGVYAVSPDQTLLAHAGGGAIVAVDIERAAIAQRIEPQGGLGMAASLGGKLRFTPDGSCMLHEAHRDTRIIDAKGAVQKFENTLIACGHDGRTAARVSESAVEVGVIESWAPLSWRESPRRIWKPGERVHHARFSPDDRMLVVALGSGRLVVLDVARGEVVLEAGDPYRPGLGLRRVEHLGFSSDGRRLFVVGSCTVHPLAIDEDAVIAVYSLTQRKALGTIGLVEDERGLYGFTTLGPHGPLSGKPKSQGARVRALLCDTPAEEVLGQKLDAALDFEDRVSFWGGPLGETRMPPKQDLRPVVDASAGLTHLLPVALQRMQDGAQAAPARFGQGSGEGATLPIPPLLQQLEWLATKSQPEREILFEDMLPDIVAREAAKLATPAGGTLRKLNPMIIAILVAIVVAIAAGVLAST
jgi:hypothetical protein